MRYARDPNEFTKRNVMAGRMSASLGDRRRSEFAKMLQGEKNIGYANVANIRQAGADRRQASTQEYGLPAQRAGIAKLGAETERTKVGTEGDRFYQGLTQMYGEDFMKAMLKKKRKDAMDTAPELPTKSDVVTIPSLPTGLPGMSDGIADLPALPGMSTMGERESDDESAWDRSTRTPIGRMFDLENVTEALKKTWRGLEYVGEGMEKGVGRGLKYLFTPRKRKEKEVASIGVTDPRG